VLFITLHRTSFFNNYNQFPGEEDSKNTTLIELFDRITTAGGFTFFARNTSVNIHIENCTFFNNSASPNKANSTRPVLLEGNGHGGAVLLRMAQCNNATVIIINSNFSYNQAKIDGGGVYLSLSEDFSSAYILLKNNAFIGNQVFKSSGGAVSLNLFRNTYNNTFIIEDCDFIDNKGDAGGAVGVALYEITLDGVIAPDSLNITRCNFIRNSARNEGTAVGLFAFVHVDETGFTVGFTDW